MQQPQFAKRFIFWSVLTVSSIYLLILVGGIVRATGSGMGCPDWPKCFGQWVPPTEISQLPADYKQVYLTQRVAKNQKLARTLASLGFRQVAGEIFAHPTQYVETDFNATKTWIEYLNRLLGALIGIFVFVNAVVALPYWRRDRPVLWLAIVGWLLTGVQGWLGSLVVSTNLLPIMVTIHMGLALFIVAILLYAVQRARWGRASGEAAIVHLAEANSTAPLETASAGAGLRWALWGVLLLTFAQIIMGTQVREEIDRIASAAAYGQRDTWVAALGSIFESHRTLAAIVVLANVVVGYRLWQLAIPRLRRLVMATWVVLALEMVAGITLAYWALPAFMQPIHLTLATLLFGTQFLTLLALWPKKGVGNVPAVAQPLPQAHSYYA
ncbi:heme A synthase [Hymenobacter sp. UV11]|uniref:COX15/CtaA family protein n=1 Tax=Hymenobacter sp. UV11 TaxID=1849735 RepID=UPI00105F994C|nr:COX15/CtaA family protein [Hymenobacter sp. UV11]TDN37477.1 cytochrome oxidase assembly protein [Hymenobacter sp. UV11]TFZ68666.1 heme A synthase [Hymenobacter sp. UV11]